MVDLCPGHVPVRCSVRSFWLRRARRRLVLAALACIVCGGFVAGREAMAQSGESLVGYMEHRFGLTEGQVRGALGALLLFAREQLPKTEFETLARRVPNAAQIMEQVKLEGIVTGPLDDRDAYETTLSHLGIGQPLASQIAPAVLDWLQAAGHDEEHDLLESALR